MTKELLFVLLACITSLANAQIPSQYRAPETFTAPEILPPIGESFPKILTTYYVNDRVGGYDVLENDIARIRVPMDFKSSVFIGFESDLLNSMVREALVAKGLRVTSVREDADIAVWGQAIYRVHLHPFLRRQLPFNSNFDKYKKSVSIVDAESKKQGVGDAVVSVGGALPIAAFNPGEFIGRLLSATLDLSGATSAIERSMSWDQKQRQEHWITFGDCYDSVSRATKCPPGGGRNLSFSSKVRFQYVDFKTFVQTKGQEPRRFNLISRLIDERTAVQDNMSELLTLAIEELVAGFPTKTGVQSSTETVK